MLLECHDYCSNINEYRVQKHTTVKLQRLQRFNYKSLRQFNYNLSITISFRQLPEEDSKVVFETVHKNLCYFAAVLKDLSQLYIIISFFKHYNQARGRQHKQFC